mmetsp:Transcript_2475/g.9079  ORF Transcript_2475/g.9079 Transcript_2475/m.9079 type:complete len:254 (-) Transcript_2475:1245-2006(-)
MLQELLRGLPPLRVFLQEAVQQVPQGFRERVRRYRRVVIHDVKHQVNRPLVAVIRVLAGRALQKGDPQRPKVGRVGVRRVVDPLRRHVRHSAAEGGRLAEAVRDGLAYAEVRELDVPIRRDQDVRGLDVPVDDALGVHVVEAPQGAPGDVADHVVWNLSPRGQDVRKGAVHEVEHEGGLARGGLEVAPEEGDQAARRLEVVHGLRAAPLQNRLELVHSLPPALLVVHLDRLHRDAPVAWLMDGPLDVPARAPS